MRENWPKYISSKEIYLTLPCFINSKYFCYSKLYYCTRPCDENVRLIEASRFKQLYTVHSNLSKCCPYFFSITSSCLQGSEFWSGCQNVLSSSAYQTKLRNCHVLKLENSVVLREPDYFFQLILLYILLFIEQRTPAFPLKNLQCSRIY